ncbi:MAG: DUF5131 family protein [Dehalococcoidales bacterium]
MRTTIPYAQQNYETVGGCDKIKSGCENCYAIPLIHRMNCCQKKQGRYKGLVKNGNWTGKIKLFEDRIEQPLRRRLPTTYFVNSRSDTFHKDVPFEFIDRIIETIMKCPQHTFLFFTKRWARCWQYFQDVHETEVVARRVPNPFPLPNVQMFFSASTQEEVDEAAPILLQLPVAKRGFSLEPLLEDVDIANAYTTEMYHRLATGDWEYELPGLDSIIVGGESGPKRRPCKLEWIESIVAQCEEAGVPVYVKQIDTTDLRPPGVLNNKVSTKPEEWPPSLRVREMPK